MKTKKINYIKVIQQFFGYGWEDLREDAENENHKVGSVLDFILQEIEEYKDEDLYFDLCENYYEIYYTINE